MKNLFNLFLLLIFLQNTAKAQDENITLVKSIYDNAITSDRAYNQLGLLCEKAPGRLIGTPNSFVAVDLMKKYLEDLGADTVFLQPFSSPAWICHSSSATMILDGKEIPLNVERINRVLGTNFDKETIKQKLQSIQLQVHDNRVVVPTFRHDLSIVEDLAEEVARIWGYQNIKEALPPIKRSLKEEASFYKFKEKIKDKLVNLGFSEAITFSIISERENISSYKPLFLENPLRKEENILRPEIFPGLLKVFQYNVYRKERELEFFEIAESFFKVESGFKEKTKLVIGKHTQNIDNFYYFKAKLEVFLADCGIKEFSLKESSLPAFSNYALIEDWGWVGVLNKEVSRRLDLENVFIAEFDFSDFFGSISHEYLFEQFNK